MLTSGHSLSSNPSHWPLLALQHDGDWLWDTRVPFGARNAPEVACRVSAAVRDKLIGWGVRVVLDVVDDFLLIEREPGRVAVALCLLMALLCALGFVISWSKCVKGRSIEAGCGCGSAVDLHRH